MWRSILAAQEVVRQESRRKIGDGEQTNVWNNNGYQTTVMPQNLEHIRVVNLMETGSKCWDDEVLQDIFNENNVQLIKSIRIPTQNQKDSWLQHLEKLGKFSVKSCYRAVQGVYQWIHASFQKKMWKLELPGKVINFSWRVCRGRLPTVVALVMKRVQINIKCPNKK